MAGNCGSCDLCCTVMAVVMEPPKPEGQRCIHCQKGACAIYESRPEPCREFQCVWLASQGHDIAMGRNLRPDQTGVVLDVNSVGKVIAHCHHPDSWKRQPMRGFLERLALNNHVIIESSAGVIFLDSKGKTRPMTLLGVADDTNELVYEVDLSDSAFT